MNQSFVTLNTLKHRITTWGKKSSPKIFLIHGWMDMGPSFNFLCDELKNNFYCIALDLRGFGLSGHTKNSLGYFYFEYLADIHALLNHFSPDEPVTLVGHSMGGNIGSLYAGTFPERVREFVNIEGFGIEDMASERGPKRVRDWIESNKKSLFKIYATLKKLATRLTEQNPKLTAEQSLFLARHLSKKVRGGFQIAADPRHKWPNPNLYQLQNIYPFWQNITARVLNVVAQNSEMAIWLKNENLHDEIDRRLAYFPKTSQKTVVPNCGHMVHLEKPKELARIIKEFLSH